MIVPIHYDPHHEDTVYYIKPEEKIFWTFHLTGDEAMSFAGKSHSDSEYWIAYRRKITKKAKKEARKKKLELKRDLELIAQNAKKNTSAAVKAAGKMDKKHLRQNRTLDLDEQERKKQKIYGSDTQTPSVTTIPPVPHSKYKNPFDM